VATACSALLRLRPCCSINPPPFFFPPPHCSILPQKEKPAFIVPTPKPPFFPPFSPPFSNLRDELLRIVPLARLILSPRLTCFTSLLVFHAWVKELGRNGPLEFYEVQCRPVSAKQCACASSGRVTQMLMPWTSRKSGRFMVRFPLRVYTGVVAATEKRLRSLARREETVTKSFLNGFSLNVAWQLVLLTRPVLSSRGNCRPVIQHDPLNSSDQTIHFPLPNTFKVDVYPYTRPPVTISRVVVPIFLIQYKCFGNDSFK
jgi:hypothetical protein